MLSYANISEAFQINSQFANNPELLKTIIPPTIINEPNNIPGPIPSQSSKTESFPETSNSVDNGGIYSVLTNPLNEDIIKNYIKYNKPQWLSDVPKVQGLYFYETFGKNKELGNYIVFFITSLIVYLFLHFLFK